MFRNAMHRCARLLPGIAHASRIIAALTTVTPLSGCNDLLAIEELPTCRYWIMVEVDTPEGLRSGSSVLQVATIRGRGWTPEKYAAARYLSEDAVTTDLGRRGKLFMILRDGNDPWGNR